MGASDEFKQRRCVIASDEDQVMKTIFIIGFCFLFLFATAAFAQVGSVLNSTPQPISVTDHPERASMHAMASDENLRGTSAYTSEHGERPLWEFGSDKVETPLGDVARAYRKEHAFDKKAVVVMEK